MARTTLLEASIKDFGGGWDTADSDLNLSSKYQPVSDNIIRGSDGSFQARYGFKLFAAGNDGVTTVHAAQAVTFVWLVSNPVLNITWTNHGFVDGDHVAITDISGADPQNGVALSDIEGLYGLRRIDDDNFVIALSSLDAVAATSIGVTATFTHDTDVIGGTIIHEHYYNRAMVIYTDIGEVYKMTDEGVISVIWNYALAEALTSGLLPTRSCLHWSTSTNRTTMIACNGYDKDKPLQIFSDFSVSFLIDKSTLSNAFVPRADWVKSMHSYVALARTEYGDTFVEFSAIGTDGTFTREASPADSVEVDVGLATETVEPVILGMTQLRKKLYVSFYDSGMIGTLGNYDASGNHVPDFNDTLSEHGTMSHRTMVSLGNDIFMADYAGVPSVSISLQSADFVPIRVSELIGKTLRQHLNNISEDNLRQHAFAVFNRNERAYMLFIQNTDGILITLGPSPLFFTSELAKLDQAILYMENHNLFEGNTVTIAGAVDVDTQLTAANINGDREIISVIDENAFVVQLTARPITTTAATDGGGGDSITVTPINDETIVYHFEYNKALKIRRWSRFRNMHFTAGATSQRGQLFMAEGKRIYLMGSPSAPIYADYVDDYQYEIELTNQTIAVGTRVLSSVNGLVYVCILEHTVTGSPTAMDEDYDNWEEFKGIPIEFALDTPWSDLSKPGTVKTLKYIEHNTKGTAQFDFAIFTDELYRSANTNALIPNREMQFSCADTGGFGIRGPVTFGSGRRTRDAVVWPMPAKGKLFKLRWSGSTTTLAKFVGVTLFYRLGTIRK